jgi:hypothetical protein
MMASSLSQETEKRQGQVRQSTDLSERPATRTLRLGLMLRTPVTINVY